VVLTLISECEFCGITAASTGFVLCTVTQHHIPKHQNSH